MLLADKKIAVGCRLKYIVDYRDFLEPGIKLVENGALVFITPGQIPVPTSTVDTVQVDDEGVQVWFYINAGALNEVFTVTVQATDTENETVVDTVQFTVVAP